MKTIPAMALAGAAIAAFAPEGNLCTPVKVPQNGFLLRADEWDCERGFYKNVDNCLPVKTPPNAYLDGGGSRWYCERGFQQLGSTCVALVVPAGAHLDNTGNAWHCDEGLNEERGACVLRPNEETPVGSATSGAGR